MNRLFGQGQTFACESQTSQSLWFLSHIAASLFLESTTYSTATAAHNEHRRPGARPDGRRPRPRAIAKAKTTEFRLTTIIRRERQQARHGARDRRREWIRLRGRVGWCRKSSRQRFTNSTRPRSISRLATSRYTLQTIHDSKRSQERCCCREILTQWQMDR